MAELFNQINHLKVHKMGCVAGVVYFEICCCWKPATSVPQISFFRSNSAMMF
eukprot:UN06371